MVRNKKFQRKSAFRRYKKMFVITAEGEKTEPEYFQMLNSVKVSRLLFISNA